MSRPTSVAFFRNLNLGQRRSPTRDQLLHAFAEAGADDAASLQVNGTVTFAADEPEVVAARVIDLLTPVCGYAGAVLVRPVRWVLDLDLSGAGRNVEVSLFDGPDPFPEALPWVPARGGLTVVRADARHAVSVNDLAHASGGTAALEALLGVPVTSRGAPTMVRLASRLG